MPTFAAVSRCLNIKSGCKAPKKATTGDDSTSSLGQIPEWPNGADCKSAGCYLRWFESIFAHQDGDSVENIRGSSSVDRALAFQAGGRGFEPRLPLKMIKQMLL